jgi:hypothetical protein
MIFLFLIFTATFRPAAPTVGDLITIEFQQPVTLDPSPSYEVVSNSGRRIVVRTFQPKPFKLSGVSGGVRFASLTVPVKSVLKPNDKLEPAPLRPPEAVAYPRDPFIAIGVAALAAVVAWTLVILLSRRAERAQKRTLEPEIAPAERFRVTVARLRAHPEQPARWATLADATRVYLASLSPHLGTELTTSQLLPRVDSDHVAAVAQILRQGDLEKFSPWGAPPADFDGLAERALQLIPVPRVEEAAAA